MQITVNLLKIYQKIKRYTHEYCKYLMNAYRNKTISDDREVWRENVNGYAGSWSWNKGTVNICQARSE